LYCWVIFLCGWNFGRRISLRLYSEASVSGHILASIAYQLVRHLCVIPRLFPYDAGNLNIRALRTVSQVSFDIECIAVTFINAILVSVLVSAVSVLVGSLDLLTDQNLSAKGRGSFLHSLQARKFRDRRGK
jgi:hypothetical protein